MAKAKKVDVVQIAPLPPEIAALAQSGFVSADDFSLDDDLVEVVPQTQETPEALQVFSPLEVKEEPVDEFESAMEYLVDEEGIFAEIINEFQIMKDFASGSTQGLNEVIKEYQDAGEDIPEDLSEALEVSKAQEKLSDKQQEIIKRPDVKAWFSNTLRELVLSSLSKADVVSLAATMPALEEFTTKTKDAMQVLVEFVNITSQKELPEVTPFLQQDGEDNTTPVIQ